MIKAILIDDEVHCLDTLNIEMEEQLESFSFFLRVHHSYLVNLNEVAKYLRAREAM